MLNGMEITFGKNGTTIVFRYRENGLNTEMKITEHSVVESSIRKASVVAGEEAVQARYLLEKERAIAAIKASPLVRADAVDKLVKDIQQDISLLPRVRATLNEELQTTYGHQQFDSFQKTVTELAESLFQKSKEL